MTVRAARTRDAAELEQALAAQIRGEVRFDAGSRALYAADGSNYRYPPIGVVVPRDRDDVLAAVEICRQHDAPLLARGGGTSLAGQCCNVAVIIDFSKYMGAVLEVDPERRVARVEPGAILDHLQEAVEPHGLMFGPDPSTHAWCTLGGMIGNDSCGRHSVRFGRTEQNVEELEVVTYDGLVMRVGPTSDDDLDRIVSAGGRRGELYAGMRSLRERYADLIRRRFPDIPRRVSGYNLDQLLPENGFHVGRALVGTESTCALTLEASVRLVDRPPARALLVLGYPDIATAADAVTGILGHEPLALEAIDDELIDNMKRKRLNVEHLDVLPEGSSFLVVEFGGRDLKEAAARAGKLRKALGRGRAAPEMRLVDDAHEQERVWEVRESGLGATAFVPGLEDTWEGWEDSAVPPDRLGDYLRDLKKLYDRYGYRGALYGHFGDGCVHTRINFDLRTKDGLGKFRSFVEEAADLVVGYGGSLSGEHGDGQSRAELLPRMFGEDLVRAFGEFKAVWDPLGRMNPGKVVEPYRIDENLRLGLGYQSAHPPTVFRLPADGGSFGRAALRCVGVGKCRKDEGGVMCPSYMVTKEEMHSTRGRAHLLFEMLDKGDVVTAGWRSEEVKEALDLCLACKACRTECPVNVDMATYKAEFLHHHYKGRLRPPAAYSMGLIYWWSRAASRMPRLVNGVIRAPGLSRIVKRIGGVAGGREIPAFAPKTFRSWFARRPVYNVTGKTVLLWPDTFTNHFHPRIAADAVEVLERLGYRVDIPQRILCCGRPLYDYGMLRLAKRLWKEVLDSLKTTIRAGIPVIGLEPSCVAAFRDELPNLFPDDEDATRLAEQTVTLSEFLDRIHAELPTLHRKAIVQRHCHHQAVMGFGAEQKALERLGLDFELLDSGCCGMAGSFGFEREKYEVSMAAGERVLLPAVREAPEHTLVLADGYSCREQIAQGTGRRALHLAQVIRMAMAEEQRLTRPGTGAPPMG
jgi:FAD/FMN-containing dehydrogenase/Fe-S oxidoreductase